MRIPLLLALLCLIACEGCFWRKGARTSPAAVAEKPAYTTDRGYVVAPEEGLMGTVAKANADLRFVVLSFPVGRMPAMGQVLNVYRNGTKVGEVRITGPQQDENVVADMVAGDSRNGDEVREK